MISVVIPCYNTSLSLKELSIQLDNVFKKIGEDYEIIFINDCSPEKDWEVIKSIAVENNKVHGINFSRNFGQHNAIIAGLKRTTGSFIVVMDGDLQDNPDEIEKLYVIAKKGYDIVQARRINRKDRFIKKIFSKMFYAVLSYLTETKQDASVGNYGIYSRQAVDSILSMGDKNKYFPSMVKWIGFNSTTVDITPSKRSFGKSSYNFYSSLKLALNVMVSFSDKPLRLTIKIGGLISIGAAIVAVIFFFRAIFGGIVVQGWASLMISLWFLSGIIIAIIGIVGLYVGKIFDSVKDRPEYIIKEEI